MIDIFFKLGKTSDLFKKNDQALIKELEKTDEDYLLNVNHFAYTEYLYQKFHIDTPNLDFKSECVSFYEKEILSEKFPKDISVRLNQEYKKTIVVYNIPCENTQNLLYCPSNTNLKLSEQVTLKIDEDGYLQFEYIDFYDSSEILKNQYQSDILLFIQVYENLNNEYRNYNTRLKNDIENLVVKRKEKITFRYSFIKELGVPLRNNKTVSQTFSVPKPKLREKIIIEPPKVYDKGFTPEPTLEEEQYMGILKIINDAGLNFERMPSVYESKSENDLRDHILFVLDPNFELGSASGETFNKKGKTDIQLRYKSSVVFVAECKFWRGEKSYFEAINQLISYLTWRNTKNSLILFVDNTEISTVLKTVENATSKHPNYLSTLDKIAENWFAYKFHIEGDKNRECLIAVQLYHIPKIK